MPQPKNKSRGVYIKVGIASAGAIALLAGGAGTFAAWNSSTSISGGSVTTGHLSLDAWTNANDAFYDLTTYDQSAISGQTNPSAAITPITGATWSSLIAADADGAGPGTAPGALYGKNVTLANYSFAPGDLLEYTTQVKVNAKGNNLKATLAATPASLSGGAVTDKFLVSPQMGDGTTINADAGAGSGTITYSSGTYTVNTVGNTAATFTVPVYVTIQLDPQNGATANNANQDKSDTLNNILITLTQTVPGAAPTPTS
jgi:alternate signal-mediated exported protein